MTQGNPVVNIRPVDFTVNISILAIFFLSGATGLIYEIAWLRLLCLTFGNTAQATSCILAVFLTGLAVGAWSGGGFADRYEKDLLCAYGRLEFAIALLSPLVTLLIYYAPAFFARLCQFLPASEFLYSSACLIISAGLLLLPTLVMGATLPILTKYLSGYYSAPLSFNRLYSVNTIGAVVGSLLACFFGFAYLGLFNTIIGAAAINAVIAVSAFVLAKKKQGLPVCESAAIPVSITVPAYDSDQLPFLYIVAALVGFTALSYEVLWTRLLRFYGISTTYSFTIMVSFFLLGLGIGSVLYQALYNKKKNYNQQLLDLGLGQYAAALMCVGSCMAMPISALFFRSQQFGGDPIRDLAGLFLQGLLFIGLPATLVGIAFPMIGGIASNFKNIGTVIGTTYGVNTCGCVMGALLVGLVMQPLMGSFKTFQMTIVFTTLIGSLAILKCLWHKKILASVVALPPVILSLLFVSCVSDPLQAYMAKMEKPKMLQYGEDSTGIVMVLQYPEYKELRTNSASVATTLLAAKRYMRLLGALPALLCPQPKQALLICFGTGTTAGALAACKNIEHIDIVEISPMVIGSAKQFIDTNKDVLSDSKVSSYIKDGRNFLLCSKQKYDLVTFEPPPLTESGVVNLYSKEFYQLVQKHLNPNGVVCQWLPLFYESNKLWKMAVQSMREVFPYISIWVPNNGEAMAIAANEPIPIDLHAMQSRFNDSPSLKEMMAETGFGDIYSVLSTFVLGGHQLDQYLACSQPVTDNRPSMEFYLPYSGKPAFVWDLEVAAGNPQQCLEQSFELTNNDRSELAKNFKALQLFRMRSRLINANVPSEELKGLIDQCLRLTSGNNFFKYAKTHPYAQG